MMMRIGIHDVPEPLRMRQERHDDTVVVLASGEIDVSSADRLRTQLGGLLECSPRLVLDLREVVFIDSSGLHCLLDIDKASRALGVEFALVAGPPAVQRLFDVTRTAERLHFVAPVQP